MKLYAILIISVIAISAVHKWIRNYTFCVDPLNTTAVRDQKDPPTMIINVEDPPLVVVSKYDENDKNESVKFRIIINQFGLQTRRKYKIDVKTRKSVEDPPLVVASKYDENDKIEDVKNRIIIKQFGVQTRRKFKTDVKTRTLIQKEEPRFVSKKDDCDIDKAKRQLLDAHPGLQPKSIAKSIDLPPLHRVLSITDYYAFLYLCGNRRNKREMMLPRNMPVRNSKLRDVVLKYPCPF